jgi:hypothetical protein|tara:strand:+ start:532 stop:1218 length:687 start_codon:yes stop_codon:yes gene_type:complete
MSITIRLNEEEEWIEFDIPTEWKDMSVSYWAELTGIIYKHQERNKLKQTHYEEKYEGEGDLEKIIGNIEIVDEVRLNGEIFRFLSGLSKEDMKRVDMKQVTEVINTLGILTEEYKPTGARSFEFEDETYYFPSEMLKKNTYGDFIESTQLDMTIDSMKNGRYDILPEQMAILCRRIGEEYDEDLIAEKAEKFKNLKMDSVMEFAFFLTNQSIKLQRAFNTSLEKKTNP